MSTKSIPAAGIKEAQSTVLRALYGWLHEGRTHATELAAPYESTEMLRRFPVVPDWLIREELRGSGVDAEATLRTLAAKGLARECSIGEIMAAWREAPWIFMECGFCIDSVTEKPIGPGPAWRLPDGRSVRASGRVGNPKLPGDRMYTVTLEVGGELVFQHSSSGGLPGCWFVLTPAGIVAAEEALEALAGGAKIPVNGKQSQRRGAPVQFVSDADRKLLDAWRADGTTRKVFESKHGLDAGTVKAACDRERKRN